MSIIRQMLAGSNLEELEQKRRAYLSALYQNAVAALNVGTDFFNDPASIFGIDLAKQKSWQGASRVVTHMIELGDYEDIIGLIEEEHKEYLIDNTDPNTKAALIHAAKFFRLVYAVYQQEQEKARIVPVSKYLPRIATPEQPYYHNWIKSGYEEKAWNDALPLITRLVETLDEEGFLAVCMALQLKEVVTGEDGTVSHEDKAAQYMAKKYLDFHRVRLAERKEALNVGVKLLDELGEL